MLFRSLFDGFVFVLEVAELGQQKNDLWERAYRKVKSETSNSQAEVSRSLRREYKDMNRWDEWSRRSDGRSECLGRNQYTGMVAGMETYLRCCKCQPNIFPFTPSLGTNKNKHLPCGVQNEDVILERQVGGDWDMRELGHINLGSVNNRQSPPVGSAKRRSSKFAGHPRPRQPSMSSKMRWRTPCHHRQGWPRTSRLRRSGPRQGQLRCRHHHRGYWRI